MEEIVRVVPGAWITLVCIALVVYVFNFFIILKIMKWKRE